MGLECGTQEKASSASMQRSADGSDFSVAQDLQKPILDGRLYRCKDEKVRVIAPRASLLPRACLADAGEIAVVLKFFHNRG